MYFSTVFVLLLTFKFIQLQPVLAPVLLQVTGNTTPFGFKYTEKTDEFLKKVIKNFHIFPLEKLKIYVSDFLQTKVDYSSKFNFNPKLYRF